jgi:hypothetical protein
MMPHVVGVLAATAVAPYLCFLTIILLRVFPDDFDRIAGFLPLIKLVTAVGTLALSTMAIPLLIFAGMVIAGLNSLGCRSRWQYMVGGGIFGLCFLGVFVLATPSYNLGDFYILVPGALSGAICGWIYWRIAMGGRPQTPVV